MLFRNKDGILVEINRYDFKNDEIYYQKIMDLYRLNVNDNIENKNKNSNENNEKNMIINPSIERILQKL